MKIELKTPRDYDVVITMSNIEALEIMHAIGKKSGIEDKEYYGNERVHEVFCSLYNILSDNLR